MKLKLTEDGQAAVIQDGKPVYIHDDGKEVAFDASATVSTISRIEGESKRYKERAQTAETKLKPYEGISDPEAAIKALTTVANLDHKKLVDAGEVEKVKAEAIKAVTDSFESKYAPVVKKLAKAEEELYAEKIGGAFTRSKFIAEKVAIPAEFVQARFGKNFNIEDGKVIAHDASGNRMYSRARPGDLAEFDEALEMLVDQYPDRDRVLKGSGSSGSGAQPGSSGNGAKRTITRAELARLEPMAQRAAAVGKDAMTIID
jgi:hypothetical protein